VVAHEDFTNASLLTLVGAKDNEEVLVLDEVSSLLLDSIELDWSISIFVDTAARAMRSTRSHENGMLEKLLYHRSLVDRNINLNRVPTDTWTKDRSGTAIPTLGVNTTYYLCSENYSGRFGVDRLPVEGSYRVTTTELQCSVGYVYSGPTMYYGVSPFLGLGSKIPTSLSQANFNAVCAILDNPAGLHVIVVGNHNKAQKIFGSGLWGLREFIVEYFGIIPSDVSTPMSIPLPFLYSTYSSLPDAEIIARRYESLGDSEAIKSRALFDFTAISKMLDLMWSVLYYDYAYLNVDPVSNDCRVANNWSIAGKVRRVHIPYNNPALVLLISSYYSASDLGEWGQDLQGGYEVDEDLTKFVINYKFLSNYNNVDIFASYSSPFSSCFTNMSSYSRGFALSLYRRTCGKDHIVMPSGSLYPKRTEASREIAANFSIFSKNKSLASHLTVFSHIWEKLVWSSVQEEYLVIGLSFLARTQNKPLSEIISDYSPLADVPLVISKGELEDIVDADLRSNSLGLSNLSSAMPDVVFSGSGSIPSVRGAIDIIVNRNLNQVVAYLRDDKYSVIDKKTFDRWKFGAKLVKPHFFEEFATHMRVLRKIDTPARTPEVKSYMALSQVITLWERTKSEPLLEVLTMVVSMLTSLQVDMPIEGATLDYRDRTNDKIGIGSTKRKLLDIINHSEAGSKLGQ